MATTTTTTDDDNDNDRQGGSIWVATALFLYRVQAVTGGNDVHGWWDGGEEMECDTLIHLFIIHLCIMAYYDGCVSLFLLLGFSLSYDFKA